PHRTSANNIFRSSIRGQPGARGALVHRGPGRNRLGSADNMRRRPPHHQAPKHREKHRSGRAGWLRAAVLGSDDAIVSTASLMIGVAASAATERSILIAGVAGLVAGAMSMAAGEFVSVSSQRDAEQADIDLEKRELAESPRAELRELATIYEKRGLEP